VGKSVLEKIFLGFFGYQVGRKSQSMIIGEMDKDKSISALCDARRIFPKSAQKNRKAFAFLLFWCG